MADPKSPSVCPNCGEPIEPGWTQCPACGTFTGSTSLLTCPNCGKEVKAKWIMCPNCNASLGGEYVPTGMNGIGSNSDNSGDDIFMSVGVGDSAGSYNALELPINKGDAFDNGRYEVRASLGAGAFAAVYRVYDNTLKREIAIKVVAVAGGEEKSEQALEQLLHEYNLRNRMKDVSSIMKSDDPRRCVFKGLSLILLPMELSDGGNFRTWLNENKSDEKRHSKGIELFKDICRGVKAIHEVDMVHMDLKPENFLLVDGHAKITDFGISRMMGDSYELNPEQLIRQGIGTPQYMSPEQFRSARQKDIGKTSDIYSLGLILYEILDGSLPFDGSVMELRDKHLNLEPPALHGSSEKWWKLVDRCLKKSPEERYSTVEELLTDIQRVQQGSALSVDVACPECGHINSDPNHKICDNCRTDISTLFCSCPRCSREVRKDVEICPDCGEQVLAFYLLQNRWKQVGQLKNSDPVEAIALLGLILREGAGEYDEQARQTIKDLRSKVKQISDIIKDAERAITEGETEKSLEKWKLVLAVFPLHKVALRKVEELESLLSRSSDLRSRGESLMDTASFKEAQKVLQESLQLIPDARVTKNLLKSCIERSSKYTASMKKALLYKESKHLQKSMNHVTTALNAAPDSEKARSLQNTLENTISKSSSLMNLAQKHVVRAEFNDSEICINKIKEMQADCKGVVELENTMESAKSKYSAEIAELKQEVALHHLHKALNSAKMALGICPESVEAERFVGEIENSIRGADNTLKEVFPMIDSARFDGAQQLIAKIKKINAETKGISDAESVLKDSMNRYSEKINEAREAYEGRNLDQAAAAASAALEICNNSRQAAELLEKVESDKAKTNRFISNGEKYLKKAQFTETKECVIKAEILWTALTAIKRLKSNLEKVKLSYEKSIKEARQALSNNEFSNAREACQSALRQCPDSQKANELKRRIQNEKLAYDKANKEREENEKNRRYREKIRANAAYAKKRRQIAVTIIVVVILGSGLFLLLRDPLLGIISIALAALASLVQMKNETDLWEKISSSYGPLEDTIFSGLSNGQAYSLLLSVTLIEMIVVLLIVAPLIGAIFSAGSTGLFRTMSALVVPLVMIAVVINALAVIVVLLAFMASLLGSGLISYSLAHAGVVLIVAIALLLLSAIIHFGRYTNTYRSIFSGMFERQSDRQFAAFFVTFLWLAFLSFAVTFGAHKLFSNRIVTSQHIVIDQPSPPPPRVEVTGESVNLRSGPGTSYDVVDGAVEGDVYFLVGGQENWYEVNKTQNSQSAWIYNDLASPIETELPGLFLRSSPSMNSDIVMEASDGEEFELLDSRSGWSKVASLSGSSVGWIPNTITSRNGGHGNRGFAFFIAALFGIVVLFHSSLSKCVYSRE